MRPALIVDHFSRDVAYAFRSLRTNAGVALTAILTLVLGIGATTAMFSVVNGVLLRPLPFTDPDRLILIRERLPKLLPQPISIPAADVVTFTRETASFEGIAGFIPKQFDLTLNGVPQKVATARVGWNLFALLGVQPAMGRAFAAEEDHPESYVAVVSYRFWKQNLGGSPGAIGTTVTLDRKPYQVIGVMPRGFVFPLHTDAEAEIWVPMGFTLGELKPGGSSFAFGALARLKPGATLAQAQADVERVTRQIAQSSPMVQRGDMQIYGAAVPMAQDVFGEFRKPLLVLFLAVLFVLLIAVVNVAGLLLARGTARQRELAIRIALGANSLRVVSQLLVESVVLGLIGGGLGLLLAFSATRTLVAMVPAHVPRLQTAAVDGRVLFFALVLSVIAALAFGAAPALFALRTNVNENLKAGGRGDLVARPHQRLRALFVVAEMALALMLLAGAGLLLRSFQRVLQVDPGFQPEHVITAAVSLSPTQYGTPSKTGSFFTQLNDKLAQIPGVTAAGLGTDLPLETRLESALTVEGYVPPRGGSGINAFSFVLGNYFQALGIPLVRGRLFTPADDENAQKVVLINQALADKFFEGRDPIGGRLKLGASAGGSLAWTTVVGIVGNVKPFGLDEATLPHTYMPYLQHAPNELKGGTAQNLVVAVRTAGDPTSVAGLIRAAAWSLDSQVPVTDMRTMEQVISESTAARRFNMVLVAFFAAAALVLAAVGLYGLMSYSVSQRTQEIGVRMALGASRGRVLRMVLASGLALAVVGIGFGIAAALAVMRLLGSFLFQVPPYDPVTLIAVALCLAAVAVVASIVPALRATRVDPMIALRNE